MTPKYFTLALFIILLCELMCPVNAEACYEYGPDYCSYNTYENCIMDGWESWECSQDPCTIPAFLECEPDPTPTPSANCVSACGYTWTSGFTADDVLLQMCVGLSPLTKCELCGWQMAAMEEQFPCEVPPSPVPTYSPTPIPTVPPPPTIPTIVPGPNPPTQIISIGTKDIHNVDFAVPTIATIAIPEWNKTTERNNITSVVGNMTDPYLNGVDSFSLAVSLVIQHLMYLPNWVMATIYTTVQPIATAFAEIIVVVSEWGSVPLQLMRLALDNTPAGIQALLIYGVCLEMVIYILRGDT